MTPSRVSSVRSRRRCRGSGRPPGWRRRRCAGRRCRRRCRRRPRRCHVEGMNCIGPTAWSAVGVVVEGAAVGVGADRDADDVRDRVAVGVEAAAAVVRLGLADGRQQLPAQAARPVARWRPAAAAAGRRRRPRSSGPRRWSARAVHVACRGSVWADCEIGLVSGDRRRMRAGRPEQLRAPGQGRRELGVGGGPGRWPPAAGGRGDCAWVTSGTPRLQAASFTSAGARAVTRANGLDRPVAARCRLASACCRAAATSSDELAGAGRRCARRRWSRRRLGAAAERHLGVALWRRRQRRRRMRPGR